MKGQFLEDFFSHFNKSSLFYRLCQYGLIILIGIWVIWDRYRFALITQWREDQATNLWLGLTQSIFKIPVGLISSTSVPNPNGMILIGKLLSLCPSLLIVSTLLGIIQAGAAYFCCRAVTRDLRNSVILSLPLLCSTILRGTGGEFWNQWVLITVNLLFAGFWIHFLRDSRPVYFLAAWILVLLAPSLYLGGLANAFVFMLMLSGSLVIILKRKKSEGENLGHFLGSLLVPCMFIFGVSVWLTWGPYFHAISIASLKGLTYSPLLTRVKLAGKALLAFGNWFMYWGKTDFSPLLQSNKVIMTSGLHNIANAISIIYGCLCVLFVLAIIFAALYPQAKKSVMESPLLRSFKAIFIFLIASYCLTPLVYAPQWFKGERPDQFVQFFPFLLLIIFLAPWGISLPVFLSRFFKGMVVVFGGIFCLLNVYAGHLVVQASLKNPYREIPESDVPLFYKLKAIKFIAYSEHFKANRPVKVDYDFGEASHTEWIVEFGKKIEKWYPAPMSIGRAFDYEFLRRYGLKNYQEGVQERVVGSGKYIIGYTCCPSSFLRTLPGYMNRFKVRKFDPLCVLVFKKH